jgi:hypothetical protein
MSEIFLSPLLLIRVTGTTDPAQRHLPARSRVLPRRQSPQTALRSAVCQNAFGSARTYIDIGTARTYFYRVAALARSCSTWVARAPEFASHIPLSTWFQYRAAAERTQSSILLLTQYPCANSSAALLFRLQPARALCDETTAFAGDKAAHRSSTASVHASNREQRRAEAATKCHLCVPAQPNGMGRSQMNEPTELFSR